VYYTTSVGIGDPATDYTLIIDTGSGNTWIRADQPYKPTSTSTNLGLTVVSFSSTYRRPLSSIISLSHSTPGLARSLEQNVRIISYYLGPQLLMVFGFSHRQSDAFSFAHYQ
jgi:hypothetical protein